MGKFDTAILLAGGQSSRMGFDKQFLSVDNQQLIHGIIEQLNSIFSDLIIVTNRSDAYKKYPFRIVEDEIIGFGPLSGIHAGLKHSDSLYNYMIACDMPFINRDYVHHMINIIEGTEEKIDAVITRYGQWIEPFNSFYCKDLVSTIEQHVKSGERKIHSLLIKSNVFYVAEEEARKFSPDWNMFMNINTMEDIGKYLKIHELLVYNRKV